MSTLIVAFPKIEEARSVRSLLVRKGYDVAVPCTSGAQVINQADALSDGIIISGYKLSDNMMSGSQGLSPTYEQAHVGLDLLTLVS